MPTVAIVKHVPLEGAGSLEGCLREAGLDLVAVNAFDRAVRWPEVAELGGVLIMGGPMNVDEEAKYPFLKTETAWIKQLLKNQVPTIGICLGAQLLAKALGAKVTQAEQKEIGWYPIMREPDAEGDPVCAAFGQTETVFQWHGDTFAIPKQAAWLFSSPLCQNQAFRYGDFAYAFQFHIEVTDKMIQQWLKDAVMQQELATLKGVIDPAVIRAQIPTHIQRLQELSKHVARGFIERVQAFCMSER
jgi:GMP synthase (glutamine-hydrolysing)